MRILKIENDKLKSQVVIPIEKVDREVQSCQFMEECKKCLENSKVSFLTFLRCIFKYALKGINTTIICILLFRHAAS